MPQLMLIGRNCGRLVRCGLNAAHLLSPLPHRPKSAVGLSGTPTASSRVRQFAPDKNGNARALSDSAPAVYHVRSRVDGQGD